MGARGEGAIEQRGVKGSKAYCILGFRVPSTSVGARGEEAKGSKAYCTLSFRVPTTSVGTRGEGQGGSRGAKGSEGMLY